MIEEHKIYLIEIAGIYGENGAKVYKVGRTAEKGLNRLKNYTNAKKCVFIMARCCKDSIPTERKIIKLFNTKYKKVVGNEYFSGDWFEMVKDINNMLNAEHKEEQKTAVNCKEKTIKIEESKPIIECQEKEASTLVDDRKKILIKIKSFMKNDKKGYYITNENDEILHYMWNLNHMDYILSGEYFDILDRYGERTQLIQENVIYDINNLNIFETIMCYCFYNLTNTFDIVNLTQENITKLLHHTNTENDYFTKLNVYGKIIYLFECDTQIDNIEGRFTIRHHNNEKYLYSFFKNDRSSVVETNTIKNIDDDIKYHEYTKDDDDYKNDDELNEKLLFCRLGLIHEHEITFKSLSDIDLYLCNDDIDELFANQRKHSSKFKSLLWV